LANKKTLIAEEYRFIYETKFDKFRKFLATKQHFVILFLTVAFLILSNFSPIITFYMIFVSFVFLTINSLTFTDKTEDMPIIGSHGTDRKYFVHIGNAVTSIEEFKDIRASIKNNPEKVLYPILIEDTMLLTHMFVVGTTGAGKTTFLVNLLRQMLLLGSGCLAVDGKGDQTVYEAFYNTAVDTGREDDFLVINFNVPEESNTFNPLLKGSADDVIDIIGTMLDTSGDNAFWSGRALIMMKGLLSLLIPLRDADLLFDPQGNKVNVLTFSEIMRWIDLQNLKELYFTIRESNDLGYLDVDGMTSEEKKRYPDSGVSIDRLEGYLTSVYVDIHNRKAKISDGSSKQHGNSFLMWNESLDMLAGRFGAIFNTPTPSMDMIDVVTNGRIVYVLLPALKVDPRTLSVLGKIILAFFKNAISALLGEKIAGTIETRYKSFARRPRVPFWGVMDEYGAYAVDGFDNVLAQARSLKVSVCILVQEIASLKKTSEIEAQRLLGNTGVKVALKVEEQKTVDEVVEMLGKRERANIKVRSEQQSTAERDIEVQEKELITTKMLKEMKPGHGYIMWAGEVAPMLVNYYEPPIPAEIPEFALFNSIIMPPYIVREIVNNINGNITFEKDIDDRTISKITEDINSQFKTDIRVVDDEIKSMEPVDVAQMKNEFEEIYNFINKIEKLKEEKA
jgi:hypothetical protein